MQILEAFRALNALNEDVFDLDADGIQKLSDFKQDDDFEDDISIIDPDAETEEELQDNYIGKVILDCCTCHSKLYKAKEEVEIDENGELANVGEECPYCFTPDGFKVIGEVAAFEAGEDKDGDGEEEEPIDELLDFNVPVTANVTANGNDVAVGGMAGGLGESLKEGIFDRFKKKDPNRFRDENGNPVLRSYGNLPMKTPDGFNDEGDEYSMGGNTVRKMGASPIRSRRDKKASRPGTYGSLPMKGYDDTDDLFEGFDEKLLTEGKITDAIKKVATRVGADATTIVRCFAELSGSDKLYDLAQHVENKAVLKALMSGNEKVMNSLTKDDIEELEDDISDYERAKAAKKDGKTLDDVGGPAKNQRQLYDVWYEDEDGEADILNTRMYQKEAEKRAAEMTKKGRKSWVEPHDEKKVDDARMNSHYRSWQKSYDAGEVDEAPPSNGRTKKDEGLNRTKQSSVNEGIFGIKTKKEKEAARKRQAEIDAYNKEQEDNARMAQEWRDWCAQSQKNGEERERRERAEREARAASRRSSSSSRSSSSPSNTGKAGVYYSGGDYYSESMNESIDDLSMTANDTHLEVTEDESGKVTVSMEPVTANGGETIEPVSPETEAELMGGDETSMGDEMPIEDEMPTEGDEMPQDDEIDVPIDEVDEDTFDESLNSYFRRVYENVESYKTTAIKSRGNSMMVEGKIKFASGKTKNTSFLFEAKDATRSGKVRFVGDNKQLTEGKKAFVMTGRVANKKLVVESMSYNYSHKDADGKSSMVRGASRVRSKRV